MPLYEIDGVHPPIRRCSRPDPWTTGQILAATIIIVGVIALMRGLTALRLVGVWL
jgi:hypothetical protein